MNIGWNLAKSTTERTKKDKEKLGEKITTTKKESRN